MSAAIAKLVAMSEGHGLKGELNKWSKADVWTFAEPMPEDVRLAGTAEPAVDYYEQMPGPHFAGDVGFIDGEAKTAISFIWNK
ncbi:hypothetical protein [Aurantiacibacter sp. MUD61]|uniref:hypothetical protein n=1 Tax=Aurantiacibacter sp. MUD61 TaxID=3009083 RepID=UPI0022F03D02|nr:hypothetical protein [Aurantiacibacter sp. MUD61]